LNQRFDIVGTTIAGLLLLQRKPLGDERGYLERLFCSEELAKIFEGAPIAQINHTLTRVRSTVRGMHFQHPPYAEIKLVSCLHGEVLDVAVDLRRGSPTFLHWHGERLSDQNHRTLAIPRGFAHGFQTLSDDCEMLYFHSAAYRPSAEDGLHPCDPLIDIRWPLDVAQISQRDASHPFLDESFQGVAI
jgi:dTDP-4-dehydrorhamnose 3,5-epimerase